MVVDNTPKHTFVPLPQQSAIDAANANAMAAIVLAGGMSQRMGKVNKLLLNYDGQSFLQQTVTALTRAGVGEVVVVLGHESEHMRQQLAKLPAAPNQSVRWVDNDNYEQGQMTSVNCGLAALNGSKGGVLICLGDQPLINAVHIRQLIAAFESREKGKQIIVPIHQGQRGNPVVLSEYVREQVIQGSSRPGCRRFIDNNPELVSMLAVEDEAFISDIDTPDEYNALNAKYDKNNRARSTDSFKK